MNFLSNLFSSNNTPSRANMPPKKGNAKAKATPAKAAAAAAESPATITTAKGKEIEATAAAGRPRRASITETPVAKKATTSKSAAKTAPCKAVS